jgi:hypothetical protein
VRAPFRLYPKMDILRLEHLSLSVWGEAFKGGHLADASHLYA